MKNNKKGFTLIELLAVIVILAIIALIATPIVLNIIERARKSAYQDSAYGLIESAKLKYVEGMLDGTSGAATYTFSGTNSGLEFSGSAPDSGELKVDANGNIALAVIYGNICYKKDYTESEVTQIDNTANCTLGTTPVVTGPKCRRATTLHTEICEDNPNVGYACLGVGYVDGNKGTTITFGQLGTGETLTSGDALDCDVNGDGTYDASTERFYYVSDLYNTTTKEFDNDYAVLVYYNNTTSGVTDNTDANLIAYDSSNENWHGPVTAIANLPTTIQWSNVSLSNTSRAILTNTETTSTSGGTLPTAFSYAGYAARLLTAQEINSACGITIGSSKTGELDTCIYLMENTKFSSIASETVGIWGYWLETPDASTSEDIWFLYGYGRDIQTMLSLFGKRHGVRPAIEVLKTDIEF